MRTNNTTLTKCPLDEVSRFGDALFTLDVTINGETRAVKFWEMKMDSGRHRAYAPYDADTAIAIAKHGGKVWDETLVAFENEDGTYRIATNYTRLNRNGYAIVGWFNTVAPNADAPFVSRHVSA